MSGELIVTTWIAGQESDCGICPEPIHKGDECVIFHGRWCHADCAASER